MLYLLFMCWFSCIPLCFSGRFSPRFRYQSAYLTYQQHIIFKIANRLFFVYAWRGSTLFVFTHYISFISYFCLYLVGLS